MEALAVSWTTREKTIQSHISGQLACIPDRTNDVPYYCLAQEWCVRHATN